MFPTTLDDVPLCGPGQTSPVDDGPLPSFDGNVDEDGVGGDVEDGELLRLEVELEEEQQEFMTSPGRWPSNHMTPG